MSSSKARYESFLLNNVATISTMESSLRSITWFLPGRFKDAELASETLTSLLNVISMYHDTLLTRIIKSNPSYRPVIPPSVHGRFTRGWCDKDIIYKWPARVLEFIRYTELVSEMILRRKVSEKTKWRLIIFLEVVKATLRMLLLRISHRPLVTPPIPERDIDPSQLPTSSANTPSTMAPLVSGPLSTPNHLQNNHVPLSHHSILSPESSVTAEELLLPKALTTDSVRPPTSLIRSLSGPRDWLSETIYILRPLVYACLLVVDRKAKERSNRALVFTLAMELLSRSLRRSPPSSALLERAEYARRDKDMLWYFLRGSVWESYTRPKVESFVTRTSQTPLLGVFGALVKDWIPLINDYYYYTAP